MKYVLLTADAEVVAATDRAFFSDDEVVVTDDTAKALDACDGADLIFVDMLATLTEPHKIAGYEAFAHAKMEHPHASATPLVLIGPPEDYELDAIVGWPGFVFAHLPRPITNKLLRRATTWI
ncbi:MAG: hypothetical protein KF812_04535 [Fimbriimonadaceae bacterium]|nr:hypothetical protein [Fimbriimonadaceae bacterium]